MPYLNRHTRRDATRVRERGDLKRQKRQKIYRSAKWRRMSNAYLRSHPLCEMCRQRGVVTPAADVHHIISFTQFDGLKMLETAYNPNNLMALCKECHHKIHLGRK